MSCRGTTILEALVGTALLAVLLTTMFLIYTTGAKAWKAGESDVQLAQSAQTVTARMARDVERSIYTSVALDPLPPPSSAVSFLSPINPTTGQPDYDAAKRELRVKQVPIAPPPRHLRPF